ncbi:ABC transporter ATP-binding protein [Paenibacillus sp. TRM 82003]|uniref:ABC transporter ATP-binding protein n=1 Tax=Kineococcus sp. TRM81007 TaxID=2925831 RepID=UPI001F562454|nr:ABC transporter ATP-binding protein [Kineococcus sp. TRM81007]MCI2239782.1 ABC transporter ATP-binding protein [Kineococcus sp. TRM81007]MCI3925914.1 ABC transporter ATP-binding protein [Paenibacillus sp. TRM 82003]
MSAPPVVEVDRVTRTFGGVVALDDVSLRVRPGEAVGVLGPNGAGKSTLLSLLAGLRKPTSGTVRLAGGDPREAAVRARLGVTPQATGLPQTLKVAEVVDFVAGHHRDPLPAQEVLERFELTGLRSRQCGGLSGGQQRRLAVALAFVGRPDVVLLDEPTTGLDVPARHALWAAVRGFVEQGGTLLLTSHYLEEVEALAHRVVVVDRGRVLAEGTVAEVRGRTALRRVRFGAPPGAVPAQLTTGARVVADGTRGGRWELLVPDADAFVRALVGAQVPFSELEVAAASLEEAFLALTGERAAGREVAA